MHWIGIDMSKSSFHTALDEKRVEVFKNTPEGIERFVKTLVSLGCTTDDTTIGTEATGVYFLCCETLRSRGWRVVVINPLLSHKVIESSLRRVKNDRHDALVVHSGLTHSRQIKLVFSLLFARG